MVQQGEIGTSIDVFRTKDTEEALIGHMDLGKLENVVDSSANRIKEDVYKILDCTVQQLIRS